MKAATAWLGSRAVGSASLTICICGTAIAAAAGCGSTQTVASDAATRPSVAPEAPLDEAPTSEAPVVPTPAGSASAAGERFQPAIAGLLGDGFDARFPRRAKVFVAATAHTRPGEREPEPPAITSQVDVSVVLETLQDEAGKEQVRLAIDTRTLRAALWMHPAALAPVVTQRSVFGSSATSAPKPKAPVGHPGLRVSVTAARNAKVEVTATYEFPSPDSGTITLEGWIDKANTGFVYEPTPPGGMDAVAGEASFVDGEVDIRTAVGGPAIARAGTGGAGVFFPVEVLTRARGFAEILVTAEELELSGFVERRVLEPLEPEAARGWGRAHFKAKLWQRWPKEQVRVPVGTCIYDAPDGEVIGVVKRSHVNNVVVLSDTPQQRAYQLPYDAVGYLYAADLAPGDTRGDDAELTTLEPEAWSCPKRSLSR